MINASRSSARRADAVRAATITRVLAKKDKGNSRCYGADLKKTGSAGWKFETELCLTNWRKLGKYL